MRDVLACALAAALLLIAPFAAARQAAAGAEPWAHGLVGLGLSTGEWWLRRRTMSRTAVSHYLSSFVWHAFEGIAAEHGVVVDRQGKLRLVAE